MILTAKKSNIANVKINIRSYFYKNICVLLLVRKVSRTVFDYHYDIMNANVWILMLLAEMVTMDKHCSVVNLKVEIRSYFQKYVFFVAAYKWGPIFMYSSCAA